MKLILVLCLKADVKTKTASGLIPDAVCDSVVQAARLHGS
jgi:hypothetical protein